MLINLRNALMTGKNLPYDAEVEYLESTGTQWIDTGVPYNSSVACECVMAKTSNTISGNYIFGILWAPGDSSTVRRWAVVYDGGANKLLPQYATTMNVSNPVLLQNGVVYKLQANSTIFAVDNTSVNVTSTTFDPTTDVNIYIFARHTYAPQLNPNPVTGKQAFRLYSFKIWKSGILVRDYIPVRKGTVGYLYDRVTGKLFGNEGTGDFVLGPDVVPVEWLGSDGNQYIDTGYVFQFGDDVSATFQPLATPTQTAYFLGADTAYNAGLNVHYDPSFSSLGLRYCYGGGFGTDNTSVIISPAQAFSTSTIYACNGNANKRTINSGENTASVQDSGLNSASVILFCGRRNANVRPASTKWAVASRFFGFGATRNGAGVRAMKPVRVGTDATSWEGAMMDTLTRRIYRNAGTGAFTYGNDLKYPIPAE